MASDDLCQNCPPIPKPLEAFMPELLRKDPALWEHIERMRRELERVKLENARLRESTRWRSVDEELPEPNVRVWAYEGGLTYKAFRDDFDSRYQWWEGDRPWTRVRPTHWQPLPEPPKEAAQ